MRNNKGAFGHEEESEEINLTPMLDVVFIMLIFFIVTATFIKEAGIQAPGYLHGRFSRGCSYSDCYQRQ